MTPESRVRLSSTRFDSSTRRPSCWQGGFGGTATDTTHTSTPRDLKAARPPAALLTPRTPAHAVSSLSHLRCVVHPCVCEPRVYTIPMVIRLDSEGAPPLSRLDSEGAPPLKASRRRFKPLSPPNCLKTLYTESTRSIYTSVKPP